MTSVAERIGLDIGAAPIEPRRAQAAADAGARIARLSFPLGDRFEADEDFLAAAREAVEVARRARLTVLGVIDGGLTVAPGGAGTWSDDAPPDLAAAWIEELAGNARRLAEALAGRVTAWEILPAPNQRVDGTARMSAARWAEILAAAAAAIRAADPAATIVGGGLVSDELADGVAYLGRAAQAGGWEDRGAPFDALGLVLRVAPEGGSSESIVKTLVSERAQRLWRAAVALLGEDALAGLWVTSVAWDAVRAGESAQARNLWTTCDTLTADPRLRAVVWSGLVDVDGATGLYASAGLAPDARRPAWTAFNDFAVYAAQIGAAAGAGHYAWGLNEDAGEPEREPEPEPETDTEVEPEPEHGREAEPETDTEVEPEPEHGREAETVIEADQRAGGPARGADIDADDIEIIPLPDDDAVVEVAAGPIGEADRVDVVDGATGDVDSDFDVDRKDIVDAATGDDREIDLDRVDFVEHATSDVDASAAPTPGRVAFRVPRIAELLRAAGLSGDSLETALDAVAARYGSRDWLPAGDYEVELPASSAQPAEAPEASDRPTNQAVLSAFYRAAGGAWSLLAKAGLDLADLVTARGEPYDGPDIDALDRLDAAEIQAVLRQLHGDG